MIMSYTVVIGFVGCGFLFISFIPQTVKVIRSKDVSSLSPIFLVCILIASVCLGIYAYDLSAYPVMLANCSVFVNNLILLCIYSCYKK